MEEPVTTNDHVEPRQKSDLPARHRTLDELAARSIDELARLYAAARVPARLSALDGDLVGRVLAVRGVDGGLVGRLLSRLAASRSFPWEGKSFSATSSGVGTGINRVRWLGRHRLFPFETRIEASVLDSEPAVVLDYGSPDNPALIRAIHDEVREVERGLFLGPACWKRKAAPPAVVLWFALDTR
jgi:hypothetical protein